jgi:predicted  nucleic acid-binding Zn-ribbon protein
MGIMTEEQLLTLKGTIEKAKVTVAELNGQLKSLMGQLKEWDCKTIEEAESKLKSMEEEISNFNNKIAIGTKDLESKYNV